MRKQKYDTSTSSHPLRNFCNHKGYLIVKGTWNVGGRFRSCECTNCKATWTEKLKK